MGRGIYLASGESGIDKTHSGAVVVQRYMHDPFLLDGFKFDLRIYALVTCVDPLAVYVYDEGIARFATTPYAAPDKSNLSQVTMHLTNYSLNKHSATFMSTDKEDEGTKRSISSLFAQMKATGHDTEKLWRDIREVVARTVLPIQPHLAHCYHSSVNNAPRSASDRESESERGANGRASGATPRGYADLHADDASPGSSGRSSPSAAGASADDEPKPSRCFELLGFDIIIDEKLRPWLIEVNHSPSFNMDSPLDARVKCGAIGDVLRALNLDGEERRAWIEAEKRAQKKRLYKTGETLRNARMGASANGVGGVGGYTDRAAGVGSSGSSGGGYGSTMGGYGSGYATMERPRSGWGRTRPKLPIPPAHSLDDDDDDSDEFSTVRTVAGYARAAPPPRRGGKARESREGREEREERVHGRDGAAGEARRIHSRVPARGSVAVGTEERGGARRQVAGARAVVFPTRAGVLVRLVRRSEANVGGGRRRDVVLRAAHRGATRAGVRRGRRRPSGRRARRVSVVVSVLEGKPKQPVADVGARRRRAEAVHG